MRNQITVASKYDIFLTPPYAIDPLLPFINPYKETYTILETAAGAGHLSNTLINQGFSVLSFDISPKENPYNVYINQKDFFTTKKTYNTIQVTNPPYSIKFDWLRYSFALGIPFALLLPVSLLDAQRTQYLIEQYIDEMTFILLDKRVRFYTPKHGWKSQPPFSVAWWTWKLNIRKPFIFGKLDQKEIRKWAQKGKEIF